MKWFAALMLFCQLSIFPSAAWAAARGAVTIPPSLLERIPARVWLAVQQGLPPIGAVHAAALRHAGLRLDEPLEWARRARRAAALPRLQLGVRRNLNDTVDLRLSDEVSVSGGGVVVGPRSSNFTQQGDRNWQLDVRALWSLPELVFNGDALLISREARERRREARALLQEVNRLYFLYRQCRALIVAGAGGALPAAATRSASAHVDLFAAELDALTGGWFAAQIGEQR
ncbi:MAG: hypothetical protein HY696_03745 [Deltaproteobacteria bacterium]|nr:hypothetical protein [Deltaproteobacteria bacterium]